MRWTSDQKGGDDVEDFLIIVILVYLMAVFTVVVRTMLPAMALRFFRFATAVMVVYFFIRLIRDDIPGGYAFLAYFQAVIMVCVFLFMLRQEIRMILVQIGLKSGILVTNAIEDDVKEEILHSVSYLGRHRIGALITFERSDSLQEYIDNAFGIEAIVSSELLSSIFIPNTPLHDGAVIIKENVIKCAGAYFPSSDQAKVPKYLGSRHRAAIGISEATDSLTVVVSEQTGEISVAIEGYLDQDISQESLLLYLEKYLQN